MNQYRTGLFKIPGKGFGIRALESIPCNVIVCLYPGRRTYRCPEVGHLPFSGWNERFKKDKAFLDEWRPPVSDYAVQSATIVYEMMESDDHDCGEPKPVGYFYEIFDTVADQSPSFRKDIMDHYETLSRLVREWKSTWSPGVGDVKYPAFTRIPDAFARHMSEPIASGCLRDLARAYGCDSDGYKKHVYSFRGLPVVAPQQSAVPTTMPADVLPRVLTDPLSDTPFTSRQRTTDPSLNSLAMIADGIDSRMPNLSEPLVADILSTMGVFSARKTFNPTRPSDFADADSSDARAVRMRRKMGAFDQVRDVHWCMRLTRDQAARVAALSLDSFDRKGDLRARAFVDSLHERDDTEMCVYFCNTDDPVYVCTLGEARKISDFLLGENVSSGAPSGATSAEQNEYIKTMSKTIIDAIRMAVTKNEFEPFLVEECLLLSAVQDYRLPVEGYDYMGGFINQPFRSGSSKEPTNIKMCSPLEWMERIRNACSKRRTFPSDEHRDVFDELVRRVKIDMDGDGEAPSRMFATAGADTEKLNGGYWTETGRFVLSGNTDEAIHRIAFQTTKRIEPGTELVAMYRRDESGGVMGSVDVDITRRSQCARDLQKPGALREAARKQRQGAIDELHDNYERSRARARQALSFGLVAHDPDGSSSETLLDRATSVPPASSVPLPSPSLTAAPSSSALTAEEPEEDIDMILFLNADEDE